MSPSGRCEALHCTLTERACALRHLARISRGGATGVVLYEHCADCAQGQAALERLRAAGEAPRLVRRTTAVGYGFQARQRVTA